MGSQWVEDPSWGNIFNGIVSDMQGAPGKALSNIHAAEIIKDQRIKRAREEEAYQQGVATGNAYEQALPPAYAPPTDYTAPGPMIGDVNNPADTQGIPTVDLQYTDPRAQARAEAGRALSVATAKQAAGLGKTSEIMPMVGYGSVAASGVPQSQAEKDRLQTLMTGKFPDRSVDESKLPPKPYIVLGPDGKVVEQGVTKDFKSNLTTGQPIKPGSIQLASPTSPDRPSDFSDKGKMTSEFAALSERVNRNEPLSIADIERAHVLREQLHQQSGSFQNMGGRQQYVTSRSVPVPDYANRLSDLIDAYRSQAHLQPAPAAPGGASPAQPPASVAPPGAGANAPVLGPQGPANPAELRKEISNTQAFSDYATAISSYNTMIKAAQGDDRTGLPTNASDLNIIYAIAKLFDPGSVVREGELKLAAGAAPIAQVLQSNWSRLITGEGSLTPETRAQLIGEGMKRMEQYKAAKDTTTDWYAKVAAKQGLVPEDVVPPTPPMLPYDKAAIQKPTLPGASAAAVPLADRVVGQKYPTPRGPMTWTGPETGWQP